ncbi:MAG: hypothetical protein ACK4M3_00175 [Pyrobaculum sp.]
MEVFAPTPTELVKRYRAKKTQDDRYVINAIDLPWVIKREVEIQLALGRTYKIEGVSIEGVEAPWEAYVALVDESGEIGAGYIVAKRRKMFRCISKPYIRPVGVQISPYIVIRPVELWLTDIEGLATCIERTFYARHVAILFNMPPAAIKNVKVDLRPSVGNV